CFPKDMLAIINVAKKNNSELSVIETVVNSNNQRKLKMANKIIKECGGNIKGKTIAILGLAFKANTDDIRYSPSLAIIRELVKSGALINAYDREAMENTKKEFGNNPNIRYFTSPYQAAENA